MGELMVVFQLMVVLFDFLQWKFIFKSKSNDIFTHQRSITILCLCSFLIFFLLPLVWHLTEPVVHIINVDTIEFCIICFCFCFNSFVLFNPIQTTNQTLDACNLVKVRFVLFLLFFYCFSFKFQARALLFSMSSNWAFV